jgi:hypothetical protein
MAHDMPLQSSVDLYDSDFHAWAREQAQALRARGAGRNGLDYDNLAEEVEDLGKSLSRACRSLVERILEHLLKMRFVAAPEARGHWRGELIEFRDQLDQQLTKSIEALVRPELDRLYAKQVRILEAKGVIDAATAHRARDEGAPSWEQVRTDDWYPESVSHREDA